MGSTVFPAPSAGGGIKLVQRGVAASAGNITITGVDTTKTFVRSFSEGAAGTVSTNSASTPTFNPNGGTIATFGNNNLGHSGTTSPWSLSGTITMSGGTMDATTKQMGVYLSNSTTLVATGACRWEVVEFA